MDLKLGGIVAAAAFGLSFLIGLISRSTMPFLIIWPLVFAAIFFVLVVLAKFLFSQFLPELLEDGDSGSLSLPGSVVNITEGDTETDEFSSDADQGLGSSISLQAASDAARPDDSEKSMGDISTLSEVVARNKAAFKETSAGQELSTGMDQNMENGYNEMGDLGLFSQSESPFGADASVKAASPPARAAAKPAKPAKSGSPSWLSSSEDGSLPDLDSMAGVFTAASEEEPGTVDNPEPSRSKKKSSNKEKSLEGDFSPKDIAEGIRTVLKKDKEE